MITRLFMSDSQSLYVLIAPLGQLSGDGQLRESFTERRDRKGADYPMWYITPEIVKDLDLSMNDNSEGVIAEDPKTIAWLKLRFGGERSQTDIEKDKLWEIANELPPIPKRRDIGLNRIST